MGLVHGFRFWTLPRVSRRRWVPSLCQYPLCRLGPWFHPWESSLSLPTPHTSLRVLKEDFVFVLGVFRREGVFWTS